MTALLSKNFKADAPAQAVARGWTPAYLLLWRRLLYCAFGIAIISMLVSPVHPSDWPHVLLLSSLAVVVSLMPACLPECGLVVSPVLPVVFAIGGLYGASSALFTAVAAATALGLTIVFRSRQQRFRKFLQFVAVPVVTDGVPILLYSLFHAVFFPHGGLGRGESPGFFAWIVLAICNFFAFIGSVSLNTYISSRFMQSRWDIIWHDNAKWNMLSGVFMAPIAFVAAVLFRDHWWLGVAFILIPTWALNCIVVFHERTMTAYKMGVEMLGRIMQESHPYTHGHLNRVAHWAKKIAEDLKLSPESMQFIEDAAILHDIGKVAVDDRVLNKIGKLSDDDWAMIRRHPVVGAEIVGRIKHFNKVSNWIMHHHERPDGGGYPSKLNEDDIPIEACIISVVDAYDAMVGGPAKEDKRPYRNPMEPSAAVDELRRHAGTQFNTRVVETFVAILEREHALEAIGEQPHSHVAPEGDSLWDSPLATNATNRILIAAGGRS